MRLAPLILTATVISGCTATPPPTAPDMRGQMMLAQMLQGQVAGPAQRCLQNSQTRTLVPVDATTIVYRDGGTTWVNHVHGLCGGLQSGTLITKPIGGLGLCDGDVAQVIDFSGMPTGSCTFGPFIPYRRP